jgi:enoyl-[acyl-carrier protein] reductase/trans-2-enoyl-CoA reductase (NAD+)
MIIKPRLIGNVSRAAHPYGCRELLKHQIQFIKSNASYEGAKKALIIGASSGYGLASRISLAFGSKADTIGVSFEHGIVTEKKLGTAGWWNNVYFKEQAETEGLKAKNFNGDAFSNEMKEDVIKYIKDEFGGKIDLLIYSLASGRRTEPSTGITYTSAIKPIGERFTGYTLNIETEEIVETTVEPATEEEINSTVKVMGGEDWELWIKALSDAGVLAEGFKTTLYSYIGPEVTQPIYGSGTLGKAKRHAEETSERLNIFLKERVNGESIICVAKAVTTKASAVIPTFPIYASALYKVMMEKGLHETPTMHIHRFLKDMLYGNKREIDDKGRLRPDSWEMREDIQKEVKEIMDNVTPENFKDITAADVFIKEFMQLSGFEVEGVNYNEDINLEELQKLQP